MDGCREYVLPLDVMCCATMNNFICSSYFRISSSVPGSILFLFDSCGRQGATCARRPAAARVLQYCDVRELAWPAPDFLSKTGFHSFPYRNPFHKERILLNPFLF